MNFYPEGILFNSLENQKMMMSLSNLIEAKNNKKILEAKAILCDSNHNLKIDLGCIYGVIPRLDGAIGIQEGVVRDIAVISKVNNPVCFIISEIKKDNNGKDFAVLSRRSAQEICIKNYIQNLKVGDVIPAKVTHLEPFGAFVDIGCGIISFLPIDTISVSRILHPKERFYVGLNIKVIVKSIEEHRINLTHKELLGTWEENAKLFSIGETVSGIIRSVESYGVFVELTPNLTGLAENKTGIRNGQQASVYIKNIIPEKMKIKLIIIDTFDSKIMPKDPVYFYKKNHMDSFLYSPVYCNKIIETKFNNI